MTSPPPLPRRRKRFSDAIPDDLRRRPLTIGLALAAVPALWWLVLQGAQMEERVRVIVRHEIAVHDQQARAHRSDGDERRARLALQRQLAEQARQHRDALRVLCRALRRRGGRCP